MTGVALAPRARRPLSTLQHHGPVPCSIMDQNPAAPWTSTLQHHGPVPCSTMDQCPAASWTSTLQHHGPVPCSTMDQYPAAPWTSTLQHHGPVPCSIMDQCPAAPWTSTLQHHGPVPCSAMDQCPAASWTSALQHHGPVRASAHAGPPQAGGACHLVVIICWRCHHSHLHCWCCHHKKTKPRCNSGRGSVGSASSVLPPGAMHALMHAQAHGAAGVMRVGCRGPPCRAAPPPGSASSDQGRGLSPDPPSHLRPTQRWAQHGRGGACTPRTSHLQRHGPVRASVHAQATTRQAAAARARLGERNKSVGAASVCHSTYDFGARAPWAALVRQAAASSHLPVP